MEMGISDTWTEVILIVAAVINGFTIGILWTSANHYVADCSSDKTKGLYFSFFWAFYMSSQVFGNLIAAFVLKILTQVAYFCIMTGIAFFATLMFLFIRKPEETLELKFERRMSKIDSILSNQSKGGQLDR
jgi:MFS family permease